MTELATDEQATQVARREQRERAINRAALSLFVPGLGQAAQHRYVDAALQFGSVAAYVAGVFSLGGGRALLLTLLWSAWSVVDAYRHEAD
jgi:hypothetical protein